MEDRYERNGGDAYGGWSARAAERFSSACFAVCVGVPVRVSRRAEQTYGKSISVVSGEDESSTRLSLCLLRHGHSASILGTACRVIWRSFE